MERPRIAFAVVVSIAAAGAACGLDVVGTAPVSTTSGEGGVTPPGTPPPPGSPPVDADGGGDLDASTCDACAPTAALYAHSASTLYRIAADGSATKIADFGGACDGIIVADVAIDHTGMMMAVDDNDTSSALYRVDPATAVCTAPIGTLGRFCNGLTFAPALSGGDELLLASCDQALYRVNVATGATTAIGPFGGGWSASGDLAWLPGSGVYATLADPFGGNDRLGKIDVATGVATRANVDLGRQGLWGLGFTGTKLVAFGGDIALAVEPTTGVATELPIKPGFTAYGAAGRP
jgi:hypothetical protein